jgi:hypothetical protein
MVKRVRSVRVCAGVGDFYQGERIVKLNNLKLSKV